MSLGPALHTPMPRGPTDLTLWRKERIDILVKALEFSETTLRLSNIQRAHPRTCTWFEGTSECRRWRDHYHRPAHHGILWSNGVAGAGKSTLMRSAYERDRTSMFFKPVAFFFDVRGRGLEKSKEGMFRSLLRQLLNEPGYHVQMAAALGRI